MQVYLDSPMAISATEIFERYPSNSRNRKSSRCSARARTIRTLPGLHFTRETAESIAINQIKGGAVIMAGSGMAPAAVSSITCGTIWRPESGIFVGYAAAGTLARHMIDGARSVRFFGEDIAVKARISTDCRFLGARRQKGLLEWRNAIAGLKTTFLVHGEVATMQTFAKLLPDSRVELPARKPVV